jgi:hypothetical protein
MQRTKLDEFKKREIAAILAVGGSRATAAKYVRCAPHTIRRTAQRDPAFAAQLKRAEAQLEVVHLTNIETAGRKNWRASAWLLERMFPERFGRRAGAALTDERLSELLGQFADAVCSEVQSAEDRRRVQAALVQLAERVTSRDS